MDFEPHSDFGVVRTPGSDEGTRAPADRSEEQGGRSRLATGIERGHDTGPELAQLRPQGTVRELLSENGHPCHIHAAKRTVNMRKTLRLACRSRLVSRFGVESGGIDTQGNDIRSAREIVPSHNGHLRSVATVDKTFRTRKGDNGFALLGLPFLGVHEAVDHPREPRDDR
jgi:hypothetical protein